MIFCSKVYKMTIEKYQPTSSPKQQTNRSRSSFKRSNSFRNERSPILFQDMIKYFLLTILTVLSTQIFTTSEITLSISIGYAEGTNKFTFYYIAYIFYFIFSSTDCMVSTCYIVLTFPFAHKLYIKCCGRSQKKCEKVWLKCANVDIANNNINNNNNHMDHDDFDSNFDFFEDDENNNNTNTNSNNNNINDDIIACL